MVGIEEKDPRRITGGRGRTDAEHDRGEDKGRRSGEHETEYPHSNPHFAITGALRRSKPKM
jgi:hypothetical protein